jgi:predicted TIM-barrel fold metal-dependent hydrolase
VALGFAWRDEETCRLHNDYLIRAAEGSGGRLVAFCTLPLASSPGTVDTTLVQLRRAGIRGFGELRPENLGFDIDSDAATDAFGQSADSLMLFHVSEPVGHGYAGKQGMELGPFYRFASRSARWRIEGGHPTAYVKIVGAHWGGGLPFFASMPEVRRLFEAGLHVDTAASSLLYDDGIYERVADLIGPERILFGSDFPLLGQKRSRRRIEACGLNDASKALILGENAMRLLRYP